MRTTQLLAIAASKEDVKDHVSFQLCKHTCAVTSPKFQEISTVTKSMQPRTLASFLFLIYSNATN